MRMKRGISLIVLIITIIVIIILAAVVILTITKNNPISSAKEATFKEDMTSIQDELSMYLSKKYTDNPTSFNKSSVNLSGDSMVTELPSTNKYKDKVSVIKGKLAWNGETENNIEYKWFSEVTDGETKRSASVRDEWKEKIAEEVEGVPIPKGFTYKEGTKDTGLVIQDGGGNEFVWIPVAEKNYVKDFSFPSFHNLTSNDISEETLPDGIVDEISDVKKYGGFYISRYEAGIPEGDTSTSNKTGIPVSKKGAIVWTDIDYFNSKSSAECMIKTNYVQSGLLTGRAWDSTCKWICSSEDDVKDSRKYGNYANSLEPANFDNGKKHLSGSNEFWMKKNVCDFAGNVWEWTYESFGSKKIYRGGAYNNDGHGNPVSYRGSNLASTTTLVSIGFRIRLYIK